MASATRAEGTSCYSCSWLDLNCYQWTRFPQGHNWRWIMGLQLWSGNKGPVVPIIPMEVAWFSTPEERVAKSQQDQDHVNCVFDWEGVVHHKYALPGQAVNKGYHLKVLHWLRDAIRQKRPQLWASGHWQLHHGNAPTHASHLVQSFCWNIKSPKWLSPLTTQIWHPVVPGFSQN